MKPSLPLVDLTGVDDGPPPKRPKTDVRNQGVSLQLSTSTFQIQSASLHTLKSGSWLNDEIVNGVVRLIAEVSDVHVVDSLALQHQQPAATISLTNNPNTKILLPMLICGNHWVLGVYDCAGLLIYDSLPSGNTVRDVSDQAVWFFSNILCLDEDDYPAIEVTSPMLQSNNNDCGIFCIIAAFCVAMDVRIPPQTNTTFWRDILFRLLRLQPEISNPQAQSVKFPKLPAEVPVSELPEVLEQFFSSLSTRLNSILNVNKKSLVSATHALEIMRRKKATKAGPQMEDISARFQEMDRFCLEETERLHKAERQITLLKRLLKLHIKVSSAVPCLCSKAIY